MKRILLLDDDFHLLYITSQIIASLGYDPISFSNPLKALESFIDFPNGYDLVITDYDMPEINGIEFSEEIQKINPEIPIVIYSAYSKNLIEDNSGGVRIKWFIQKPFEIDCLSEIIQSAFVKGRQSLELS